MQGQWPQASHWKGQTQTDQVIGIKKFVVAVWQVRLRRWQLRGELSSQLWKISLQLERFYEANSSNPSLTRWQIRYSQRNITRTGCSSENEKKKKERMKKKKVKSCYISMILQYGLHALALKLLNIFRGKCYYSEVALS